MNYYIITYYKLYKTLSFTYGILDKFEGIPANTSPVLPNLLLPSASFLSFFTRRKIHLSPATARAHYPYTPSLFLPPKMSVIPSKSLSLSLKSYRKNPRPSLLVNTLKKRPFCSQVPQFSRSFKCGALVAVACSTSSPLFGKVGWNRRGGNLSLLLFGENRRTVAVEVEKKADNSQVLSALLPFVVALTAIAALSQPATFSWYF